MTPAQMFDQAFEEAFQDRKNLIDFLKGLDAAHVAWKPPDGEWSILEGLEHILLTDEFFRDFMAEKLGEAQESGEWDTEPENPEKMSTEALRRREQGAVPAPDFLMPKGMTNFEEMLTNLMPSKVATHEALIPYREVDLSRFVIPNMRYGDLNLYERIIYSGIHDYLHQEQMERVHRMPGYPRGTL